MSNLNFSIRIIKNNNRIGDIFEVQSITTREIRISDGFISATGSNRPLFIHVKHYMIQLHGLEYAVPADDCEIVKDLNILEII